MILRFCIIASLLFTVVQLVHCQQTEKGEVDIAANFENLVNNYPHTKIYVHTDKPYYALGDNMWFSIKATNAFNHALDPLSKLAYLMIEDEDGEVKYRANIPLDGKFGNGDFIIGRDWLPGKYTVKAFTNYMRNYDSKYIFSKSFQVIGNNDLDDSAAPKSVLGSVLFFPESGELVAGIMCKVAFEMRGKTDEELKVYDSRGNFITIGKRVTDRLGYFSFIPDDNLNYYAEVSGVKHQLPIISKRGYNISVNNLNKDYVFIDLASTVGLNLEGAQLIGHIRGNIFLSQQLGEGNTMNLKIDKKNIPSGIAQFTLITKNNIPVAERTFFIHNKKETVTIETSIPYTYFNQRQEVPLSISLTNADGQPIMGTFSISVTDRYLVERPKQEVTIVDYLLGHSDVGSCIGYLKPYLDEPIKSNSFILDLEMMTKGWTRLKWRDIIDNNVPKIETIPEEAFTISGVVLENGNPVEANVELVTMNSLAITQTVTTRYDGGFSIRGVIIPPNTNIFLRAFKSDGTDQGNTDNLLLVVDKTVQEKFKVSNVTIKTGKVDDPKEYFDYLTTSIKQDSTYASMFVELEEVSITSRNIHKEGELRKDYNILYTNYDKRLFIDSLPGIQGYKTIFDIVRENSPGVEVVGRSGQDQRFRLRGGSNSLVGNLDAKILLDGSLVSYEVINTINLDQVAFVDVLRGLSSSAIYNAPNGLVAIYTKRGKDYNKDYSYMSRPDYMAYINHEGFNQNREFYSPDYSKPFAGNEKIDYRSTLYWHPRVDSKGDSVLKFFTADRSTEYHIDIQGVTSEGIPFSHMGLFSVN